MINYVPNQNHSAAGISLITTKTAAQILRKSDQKRQPGLIFQRRRAKYTHNRIPRRKKESLSSTLTVKAERKNNCQRSALSIVGAQTKVTKKVIFFLQLRTRRKPI
jgi:hypothetical protein